MLSAAAEKMNDLQRTVAEKEFYIAQLKAKAELEYQARLEAEHAVEVLKTREQHLNRSALWGPQFWRSKDFEETGIDTTNTLPVQTPDTNVCAAPLHKLDPAVLDKILSSDASSSERSENLLAKVEELPRSDPPQAFQLQEDSSVQSTECEAVLDLDFQEIIGQQDVVKKCLVSDLTRACGDALHRIVVTALRAGSVIADVVVERLSPDGCTPLESVRTLQKQIRQPDSLLMQGKYSCKIVSLTVKGERRSDTKRDESTSSTQISLGLICYEDNELVYPRIFVAEAPSGAPSAKPGRIRPGDLLALVGGELHVFAGNCVHANSDRSCCADEDVYGKTLGYVETVISKLPGASVRLGFVSPKCGSYCIVNLERRARQSNELDDDTNDNPLLQSGEYLQRRDATHANPLATSGQTIYRRSLSPVPPYFQELLTQDLVHDGTAPYSPRQIPPLIESPMQMHTQGHTLNTAKTPLLENEPADMSGLTLWAGNRDYSTPTTDIITDATPGLCNYCGAAPGSLQEGGGVRQFRRCKRCKSVDYCSEKCQRTDWHAGHKQKCKQASAQPVPPSSSDTIIAEQSPRSGPSGASANRVLRDGAIVCEEALARCPQPCFNCGAAWGSVDEIGNVRQFRHCARCKIAEYCSDKCQRSHWNAKHKKECPESPCREHAHAHAHAHAHEHAHAADLPASLAEAYGVRRDVPDLWAIQLHNAVFPNHGPAALQKAAGQSPPFFNPFASPPNMLFPPAVPPPFREFLAP
jgi:hypothetical protein